MSTHDDHSGAARSGRRWWARGAAAATLAVVAPALPAGATNAEPATAPPPAECRFYRTNNSYPLRQCDRGIAVRYVQWALHHSIDDTLAVDGYFGPATHAALLEYQRRAGLEVDGLVGPATWASVLTDMPDVGMRSDSDPGETLDPWEIDWFGWTFPYLPCDDYVGHDRYPLRMCDTDPAVAVAQAYLHQQPTHNAYGPAAVDGHFGRDTLGAVVWYQKSVGLYDDGLIGPTTWRTLTAGFHCGDDVDGDGLIDPNEVTADPTSEDPAAFLARCG